MIALFSHAFISRRHGQPRKVGAKQQKCRQTQSLSAFLIISNKKAGAVGIEPTSTVLETAVLPLNYAPVCRPYRTDELYYSTGAVKFASPNFKFFGKFCQSLCQNCDNLIFKAGGGAYTEFYGGNTPRSLPLP